MKKLLLVFAFSLYALATTSAGNDATIVDYEGVQNEVIGDIMEDESNENQKKTNEGTRVKRQVAQHLKWINNTVYYYFTDEISEAKKALLLTAQEYLKARTCINFVEDASNPNALKVINGKDCSAFVGMRVGGKPLSIGPCAYIGSAMHELLHVLGAYHMQERPDRDEYVELKPGARDFILLYKNVFKTFNYTPYEYGSLLHYPYREGFVAKDTRYSHTIGTVEVSFYDLEMVNLHYGCHDACKIPTAAKCKNGGVPLPRNCSVCMCPSGYGGLLCDERPPGCGQTFTATPEWEYRPLHVSGSEKIAAQEEMYRCNNWVTAPAGKQIEIMIMYLSNERCAGGCTNKAIEIKTEADLRITNPKICCKEHFNTTVFKSLNNPTAIVSYDSSTPNGVSVFKYRYVDAPTTTTTTKPPSFPAIPRKCEDLEKNCNNDTCTYDSHDELKKRCAKTCGLCGIHDWTCEDKLHESICGFIFGQASYPPYTVDIHPLELEYWCGKRLGFCSNPN